MLKFPSWVRSRGFIFTLCVSLSLVLTVTISNLYRPSNTLHLAMLAPIGGPYEAIGQEMVQATEMYLEEINHNGGIDGKPVKLEVFDDRGNVEEGKKQAQNIAEDSRILLALGSYFSSISIPAGQIYQQANLPAITATATAPDVTTTNDVYFRVLLSTEEQGILLANYVKQILKQDRIGIIFDSHDAYSRSLSTPLERTFRGLGGQVTHKWELNGDSPDVDRQVDAILKDLGQSQRSEIGTILLITLDAESVNFIVQMKRQGLSYPIVGSETLSSQGFLSTINQYPEAIAQPGYFTDRIYAASPLIYDVVGERAQEFRRRYVEQYQADPTWVGTLSYDAVEVAVEALKRAQVTGDRSLVSSERQAVLQELSQMRSLDRAVEGLDGPIYFDRDRNFQRPIAVGMFDRQQLVSAPVQLQPIANLPKIVDLSAELQAGNILRVGGDYTYVTHIAYTGIDINEISDLDLKEETYLVDFFLWFRYGQDQAAAEVENIEFLNAIEPIKLSAPIYEIHRHGMITRAFRIKARFEGDFDFRAYPFDSQNLTVEFRHTRIPREQLIYVSDIVGMNNPDRAAILRKFNRSEVLVSLHNWKFKTASFFENINKNYSSLGNTELVNLDAGINYSQFNANIELKRRSFSFSINNLLPVGCFVWILYLLLFFPLDKFDEKAVRGILIGVVFFHVGLKSQLPGIGYIVALDVIFYVIYGLISLQFLLIIAVSNLRNSEKHYQLIQRTTQGFRVFFLLYLLVTGLAIRWHYEGQQSMISSVNSTSSPSLASTKPEIKSENPSGQIILTLGTWKPEYTTQIIALFAAFEKEYPRIQLKHISAPYIKYGASLSAQLQKGVAPDLIFLRAYSADRQFFDQGYIEPLNELPGLKTAYSAEALEPWRTEKGEIYGVPLSGVAHGIYYNVDLFEELNLEIPQTWSELLEVADILKSYGYIPFGNSLGNSPYQLAEKLFEPMFTNFVGGREGRLAYERGDRCFNDPEIVAALSAMRELKPYLSPENKTIYQSEELFASQKAAMLFMESWEILSFEAANLPFEWCAIAFPPPEGKPGYTVFHPDFAVGLNANSPHKQAAKQFLQWLTTPEASEILANQLIGNFALHKDRPEVRDRHAQAFLKFIEDRPTDVRWTYPKLQEKIPSGKTLIEQAVVGVLNGEVTPEEAANSLQQGLAEWYQPAQICGGDRNDNHNGFSGDR